MTKKHIKYPVMGKVTAEELRDLAKSWDIEKLYKKIDYLNTEIEVLDALIGSIIEQRQIMMKVLKKREAKKYG
jgi:hypothetical protein